MIGNAFIEISIILIDCSGIFVVDFSDDATGYVYLRAYLIGRCVFFVYSGLGTGNLVNQASGTALCHIVNGISQARYGLIVKASLKRLVWVRARISSFDSIIYYLSKQRTADSGFVSITREKFAICNYFFNNAGRNGGAHNRPSYKVFIYLACGNK